MSKRVLLLAVWMSAACLCAAGCRQTAVGPVQSVQPQDRVRPYAEGRREERREQYEGGQRERDGGGSRGRGRARANATPGAFDFYLLTLSWSPEFCVTHPQAAECAAHPGFVLHGLWPQNNDGSYPEDCSNAPGPTDPQAYRDILPDVHLLEHEWQTHGTCSGLGPDAYFSDARQAVQHVVVPRDLQSVSGELQLKPQQILGEFAQANPGYPQDSFALSCGNNQLTAVEVCLTKDLKATSCEDVRSCRANVVKVTPPGAQ
jgi:ribonuclease T2